MRGEQKRGGCIHFHFERRKTGWDGLCAAAPEEDGMKHRIDRERIKAFILRKKANFWGLLMITTVSIVATVVCALIDSPRTGLLAVVTALLVLLCFLQAYRMRSSYRTIRSFRGQRKKRKETEYEMRVRQDYKPL